MVDREPVEDNGQLIPMTAAMSLRNQIISRILLSSLCILLIGGAIAIWQARNAVKKEVDASINMAVQLISLGLDAPVEDLSRFGALQQTRHLSIQLHKPDGQLVHFSGVDRPSHPEDMPPAWFVAWVQSDYPKVEHQLRTRDGKPMTLVIQAQPLDEITEVWEESVGFFASLSLLTLLSFFAVNLVLSKSLKAIASIVEALRIIETGQYRYQLPQFSTMEFDSIANAINHMTVELEKSRQENRALTQHSLAIQEEERQRLSQELHDELGQSLTAIKVMAVTAAHQRADTAKITSAISDICDHLMTVVRSMMQQLHPLVLTELGLKATLEDLVNHWSERNPELNLTIDCSDEVDSLDKVVTIQIFRVIQECLTNVVRHAQARRVAIALSKLNRPDVLQLRVEDDGRGCDLMTVNRGFGLRGIKERIKSLDGELDIRSAPDRGMTIQARIPLA